MFYMNNYIYLIINNNNYYIITYINTYIITYYTFIIGRSHQFRFTYVT